MSATSISCYRWGIRNRTSESKYEIPVTVLSAKNNGLYILDTILNFKYWAQTRDSYRLNIPVLLNSSNISVECLELAPLLCI